MKISTGWKLAALAPALMALVLCSWSCSRADYSGKVETVTIGQTPNETNTLLYLAQERGFFAANSLNVVFKDYGSGVEATNVLLKGAVDLATCAEFVIVGRVFAKENMCSMTNIDKFENAYIIGRIDKGIRGITDLKGKKSPSRGGPPLNSTWVGFLIFTV